MNIEEVRQIMLKSDIAFLKKALDDYNINEFDRLFIAKKLDEFGKTFHGIKKEED